jgi:UDP-glucose 4-epimerase
MVLRSSGLQQRDFIGLQNVGRAVRHLLNLPRERCVDGLFNLGGENVMTVWTMVQRIAARCEATLGYTPTILRPEPLPNETTPALHYAMDKLKKTGFDLVRDIDTEIDATLQLSAQAFGMNV